MLKSIKYAAFYFTILVLSFSCLLLMNCTSTPPAKDLPEINFSMLFVGDILLANEVERRILEKGIEYPTRRLKHGLKGYDFIVANLEAPISDSDSGKEYQNKWYTFQIPPKIAECIIDFNIDVVSLSNNHLMDFGVESMEETKKYLERWMILHTGSGKNNRESREPVILRRGKTEICLLSYCNRPPVHFYATDTEPGISILKMEYVEEDIKKYKRPDNIVLVLLHWGIEKTDIPRAEQRKQARSIIDYGADGIIGHHPHWPQGIEIYKNRPIVYSLGNFINGFYNDEEKDNMMTAFFYKGARLHRVEILPLAGKNYEIEFQPRILKGKNAMKHLLYIKKLSQKLGTKMKIEKGRGIVRFQ